MTEYAILLPDNEDRWAPAVSARSITLLAVDQAIAQAAHQVTANPGDEITDELLRLVFLCAHPSLDREAAAALTLRLVLGVSTTDIARLFLVSTPTMAARLTRARKKIVGAAIPMTIPRPALIAGRIDLLADVAYLAFTAGYSPTSGPDLVRAELAGEAIRLVRVILDLLPATPVLEVLLCLMLFQHSRRNARVGADGVQVLLPDQDRNRWHHGEIAEAAELLTAHLSATDHVRADLLDDHRYATFAVQALIAAEHCLAPPGAVNWTQIADWYLELERLTRSPVVRLNRAVAVAEASGPAAGIALLDGLDDLMPDSHRVPAVRAQLLVKAGDQEAAVTQFAAAISLCGNEIERTFLAAERAKLAPADGSATRPPDGAGDG